jgi:2-hydroxycyclohexanecarboxyl-CoA dehydrogenase
MAISLDMDGRTALVTGGGNGIGAAISEILIHSGADVWVNDIHAERAQETVARLNGAGPGTARTLVADITDYDSVISMREKTGPVDILINNAGIPTGGLPIRTFAEQEQAEWEPIMRLNLAAVVLVTHTYLNGMIDQGWGRIVTIVSDAGRRGERKQVMYGAAKAAAMGFSRGLAAEVGRQGVTVNCIALASMKVGILLDAIEEQPELEHRLSRPYPVGRLGLPSDVAPLAALLCSDAGAWITGQVYPVDGGYVSAL